MPENRQSRYAEWHSYRQLESPTFADNADTVTVSEKSYRPMRYQSLFL